MILRFVKKHILLCWLACISSIGYAQVQDQAQLVLTAKLNTTLSLDIENSTLTFEFNTVSDYVNGLGQGGTKTTEASVYSTANWKLAVRAQEDSLQHNDGIHSIPLNYVGYKVELTGNYNSDRIQNLAQSSITALTNTPELILTQGNLTNAGTNDDNAFEISWEMGTGNGNTNSISLLEGNFRRGIYQATIDFTLTEIL